MSNFKIIKKGYSQLEVDSYIEKLKNDYESKLAEQKDKIFYLQDELNKLKTSSDNQLVTSLLSAVEKAKLIENSSKNIYELETKKLNLLYIKMENLLKDENICNDRSIKNELLLLIKDYRSSLQNNVEIQTKSIKENSSGDPVKRLLSKMIGFNKMPTYSATVSKEVPNNENPKEITPATPLVKKVEEIKTSTPVNKKTEQKIEKIETKELNQFLANGKTQNSTNFEHILFKKDDENNGNFAPNESGFDLKEAINPKEDLEEIMKAFDFYNNINHDEE